MDEKTQQNLYLATAGVGAANITVGSFNVLISVLYMFICIGFITIIPAILQVVAGCMQLAGMRNHVVTGLAAMGLVASIFTFNMMGMMGSFVTVGASFFLVHWEQQQLADLEERGIIDADE